ncbi:MAG: hypothetical protein FJW39_31115 [Acidobacteria bacterium]|nr:hypothetical protein [Acidobacteriota bacterium]
MSPAPPGGQDGDDRLRELRELLAPTDDESRERVAKVLAPAVQSNFERGPDLHRTLKPVIRETLLTSIKHDPGLVVEAMLPAIGTLIRRYISQAIQELADSVNLAQEQAISLRSLEWRWEAWRTGKPFGEIVLAKSLLYKVEQVFLIHRETGLLLMHRTTAGVVVRDADMVSGMLTAIEDFVQDSFAGGDGHELDTIQVGDLRVWLRHGSHAVLAAVIHGVAPPQFGGVLERTLAGIEEQYRGHLSPYRGDPSVVSGAGPALDRCLLGQAAMQTRPARVRWRIWAAAAVATLTVLAAFRIHDYWKWRQLVGRLGSEPGYALTLVRRGWIHHSIEGLRDPLADPPAPAVESAGYRPDQVSLVWRPFVSLDPRIVARREWQPRKRLLEETAVLFETDSAVPDRATLDAAASRVRDILECGAQLGKQLRIHVSGGADGTGTEARNEVLARQRATAVAEALAGQGTLTPEMLVLGPRLAVGSRTVRFKVEERQ